MKPQRKGQAKPVQVFLPLTLHLKGGRKTIISPAPLSQVAPRKPSFDNAMIKAVARAFSWRGRIEQGEFQSITELAKAERVNPSYACRLLRLTLLAPEIVQAIVDGNQPADLTLHHLLQPFPSDWEAQCKVFRSSNEETMDSDAKQYSEESGLSKAEWRRARREAAKLIDPETAEVECEITPCIDPYGLEPQLVEEYPYYGREYFARMPGNPVWVSFGDLPAEVSSELLETHFLCHVEPTQEQIDRVEREKSIAEYLSVRKAEALRIDPAVAETDWSYAQIMDPYYIYPDLPDEMRCVGRVYFARNPGSDIWVWFG